MRWMPLLPLALLAGACQAIQEPTFACTDEGWPSVVVEVRDASGQPAARGASLLIRDGEFVDSAGPADAFDGLTLGAGNRRAGTYEVRVSKPGYQAVSVGRVHVPGGACGAKEAARVGVTLRLLPGAPPVRSVVVYPPVMGLGLPGIRVQMRAYVDADVGIDTTVAWSISDTTVATLTPEGLLTSRCRARTGDAVVTATSRADPSKRGHGQVTVGASSTPCP